MSYIFLGRNIKLLQDNKLAENKLLILYLLNKMGVSLSNNDICQFAMERDIMDYISVQQCLTELTNAEYLDSVTDNGSTRYYITKEGSDVLGFFQSRITEWLLSAANEYIINNKQRIKSEYEISANYFPEINGEYLVKCEVSGLDGNRIMGLDVVVPTKSQALHICTNWKKNVTSIYGKVFAAITEEKKSKTIFIKIKGQSQKGLS